MIKEKFIIGLGVLLFCFSCEMPEKEVFLEIDKLKLVHNESSIGIDSTRISRGQLLFIATYSGVQWSKDRTELVGANLSVRNTSRTEPITIKYVDFYDDHGELHENYLDAEIEIAPMGSKIFHIHQYDEKGGAGSNFLVEWESKEPVSYPYVENVSFRLSGAQSFSFSSYAIVLRDRGLQ